MSAPSPHSSPAPPPQGMLVTIAIGLHNVPEGMAVAGVMMSKGSSPTKALYWTLLCSFPQVRRLGVGGSQLGMAGGGSEGRREAGARRVA